MQAKQSQSVNGERKTKTTLLSLSRSKSTGLKSTLKERMYGRKNGYVGQYDSKRYLSVC